MPTKIFFSKYCEYSKELYIYTQKQKNLIEMNNYLEEIEEWENSFECNECGNNDHNNYIYDRTVANGEVWHCKDCGNEIMVEEMPK